MNNKTDKMEQFKRIVGALVEERWQRDPKPAALPAGVALEDFWRRGPLTLRITVNEDHSSEFHVRVDMQMTNAMQPEWDIAAVLGSMSASLARDIETDVCERLVGSAFSLRRLSSALAPARQSLVSPDGGSE